MPPFARFVMVVIVAAVLGSFGLLVFVNYRTGVAIAQADSIGQQRAQDLFAKLDRHFRRLDITAAAQQIDGDHKVISTTVAWQEWGFTHESPDPVPMEVHTLDITGDEVTVNGVSLQFQDNFILPAEFKAYSSLFASKIFMFFTTLNGDGPKDLTTQVTPEISDPPPCLLAGATPTSLERRLWQSVWGLCRTPKQAGLYGLLTSNYPAQRIQLHLGTMEKVWIQDSDAIQVREDDDAGAVRKMLDALTDQRAKAAAKAIPSE
jgi:hypothetical protein